MSGIPGKRPMPDHPKPSIKMAGQKKGSLTAADFGKALAASGVVKHPGSLGDGPPLQRLFEPIEGAGGVPLMLSPQDRAKRLVAAGLPAGWVLVSRGEFAIIDRNTRHLIGRHNAVAAQARTLQIALTAIAVEGKEPTDIEKVVNDALDLVIPPDLSDQHIQKPT